MTARTPILDRAADALIAAVWWLDQRTPGRCPVCRCRVVRRRLDAHYAVDHADEWP